MTRNLLASKNCQVKCLATRAKLDVDILLTLTLSRTFVNNTLMKMVNKLIQKQAIQLMARIQLAPWEAIEQGQMIFLWYQWIN